MSKLFLGNARAERHQKWAQETTDLYTSTSEICGVFPAGTRNFGVKAFDLNHSQNIALSKNEQISQWLV